VIRLKCFTKVSSLEDIRRNQTAKNGINSVSLIKTNHLRCRAKITFIISEERKKRVIDLYYNQGKTTREIAEIERVSIRDISAILKMEE
jgi:DNA-directed RNA polymerase specialized sigma subunit